MKIIDVFRNSVTLSLIAIVSGMCLSFASMTGDWDVPSKYKSMKNPIVANGESLDLGKTIYAKHCRSCHGKYGEGDGPKAKELDTPVGDFTDGSLKKQSDGELFYKTLEGKDDMPSFKKKLPDEEDIWHVVNYMRKLAE